MKSALFAIILSMVLNFAPIGDLSNLIGIPSHPLISNLTVIELVPANGYIPKESELDAAKASVEYRLSMMNLHNYTVTGKKKGSLITVHIPGRLSDENFTGDEIASELCRKIEVTFMDPEGNVIVEGKHITKCIANVDTEILGSYMVRIEFNEEGKRRFADATARLIGQEITIYVDGEVISSPAVEEAITDGEAVINRIDTSKEAMAVADKITAGMLPYELIAASIMQTEVIE